MKKLILSMLLLLVATLARAQDYPNRPIKVIVPFAPGSAVDFSSRFQKLMMHVLDVPQFAGIRIHAGNNVANTEGCILLGEDVDGDTLVNSRVAVNRLQNEVAQALDRAEAVNLTVERE